MLLLLLLSLSVSTVAHEWSPLDGHGGIFHSLELSPSDISLVSRLHATASYHDLFAFVKERLRRLPHITHEERRRIEKFLMENQPPAAISTFLDDADRNYIAVLHSQRNIMLSGSVVEAGIKRLPKADRRKVVEYIWKNPEPFMLEYFGLQP